MFLLILRRRVLYPAELRRHTLISDRPEIKSKLRLLSSEQKHAHFSEGGRSLQVNAGDMSVLLSEGRDSVRCSFPVSAGTHVSRTHIVYYISTEFARAI